MLLRCRVIPEKAGFQLPARSPRASCPDCGEGERAGEGPPLGRSGNLPCALHCGCAGRARAEGGGDAEGAAAAV